MKAGARGALLLLLAASALVACGKTGPPVAPERATPEALQQAVLGLRGEWR